MLKRFPGLAAAAAALAVAGPLLAAPARAEYGAIAYSPATGGYGFSHGFGSRKGAERFALQECKARARGCRVAIWFESACGSVASGARGGWGSAWGYGRAQAEANAIDQCSARDTRCQVRVWACTD